METTRQDREKDQAARCAVERLREGVVVGLGSGSTVAFVVRALGERARKGFPVEAVAASASTERLARAAGIPMTDLERRTRLDVTIDGADEVDERWSLSKGGGGALLHEKVLASASDRVVIVVDSSKMVRRLGAHPVSVEVVPFGWRATAERVQAIGGRPTLRAGAAGEPFVTEEGNYVLDCRFGDVEDPGALGRALDGIVGVAEHGLFVDMADEVLVGRGESVEVRAVRR